MSVKKIYPDEIYDERNFDLERPFWESEEIAAIERQLDAARKRAWDQFLKTVTCELTAHSLYVQINDTTLRFSTELLMQTLIEDVKDEVGDDQIEDLDNVIPLLEDTLRQLKAMQEALR